MNRQQGLNELLRDLSSIEKPFIRTEKTINTSALCSHTPEHNPLITNIGTEIISNEAKTNNFRKVLFKEEIIRLSDYSKSIVDLTLALTHEVQLMCNIIFCLLKVFLCQTEENKRKRMTSSGLTIGWSGLTIVRSGLTIGRSGLTIGQWSSENSTDDDLSRREE